MTSRTNGVWRWFVAAITIAALAVALIYALNHAGIGAAAEWAAIVSLLPALFSLMSWAIVKGDPAAEYQARVAEFAGDLRRMAMLCDCSEDKLRSSLGIGDKFDPIWHGEVMPDLPMINRIVRAVVRDPKARDSVGHTLFEQQRTIAALNPHLRGRRQADPAATADPETGGMTQPPPAGQSWSAARVGRLWGYGHRNKLAAVVIILGIPALVATGLILDHRVSVHHVSAPPAGSRSSKPGSPSPAASHSPAEIVSAWSHRTLQSVDGSPAVLGGYVYIADDGGVLYAFNARTGAVRWQLVTHKQIDTKPYVAGNTVYVGNDAGNFYAVDTVNGKVRWMKHFAGGIDSSATVAGHLVYFGDGNNLVHALNTASGATVWTFSTSNTVQSSPLVRNGVLYVGSEDGNVYAISAQSGQRIWATATGGPVDSSPAVVNGVLYVGSGDRQLFAMMASSGKVLWTYKTGGAVLSSPFVADGVVYVGSKDGNVYAIEHGTGTSGKVLWSVHTDGQVNSSPNVKNGVVYIGSNDGNLYVINAVTGIVLNKYRTNGDIMSSPAVAYGLVYFGSDNDSVMAVKAVSASKA